MKTMNITHPLLLCVQVLLALALPGAAAAAGEADRLFGTHGIREIVLRGPIRAVREQDADSTAWESAELQLDGGARYPVRIRARGKSRLELCRFPPLWVDFKRKQVRGSFFDGQNRVKLVTHCRRGRAWDQNVLKEYLAYRVMNMLTPLSFRVRLVRITYVEAAGGRSHDPHLAFFIEHPRGFALRTDLQRHKVRSLSPQLLDQEQRMLVAAFQHFIGNTDYSMIQSPGGERCCHNVRLFRDTAGRVYPVPYDFDVSGWVNPSYATPPEQLPIRRVTERLYRGFCEPDAVVSSALQRFAGIESRLLEDLPEADLLRSGEARVLQRFVAQWSAGSGAAAAIATQCRQIPADAPADRDA